MGEDEGNPGVGEEDGGDSADNPDDPAQPEQQPEIRVPPINTEGDPADPEDEDFTFVVSWPRRLNNLHL